MEHEMCISQEQYELLLVKLDGVKSDVEKVGKEIGQIHDAVYGNGKAGLLTRMSVMEVNIQHMEDTAKERTDDIKESQRKEFVSAEKHRVNWKDVAYIVFPIVVFLFQYLLTKVI